MLSKIPTPEEIKDVVFNMNSNKVPGADGMSAHFYKFYWNIIGGEVIEAITTFFQRGYMLREINHSFIVLIPKGNNTVMVSQFKPISLCNVLYKIISKLLTNRLKLVLPKLISPWQTAFILGRKIQENTFLAQEIIHDMKKKRGKKCWMGLKIDMEKAYDRLDWCFLEKVLHGFDFPRIWIQWVMQCVTTTSFSILLNGSPFSFFKPKRGLRQGDLLSPFLFILAAEVLARLIEREAVNNKIIGYKLAPDLMPITHLQFVDDLFIFAQADEENMGSIKVCLDTYTNWSIQKVNFLKLVTIFSKNVNQGVRSQLANYIGIQRSNRKEKYLGIPMASGRDKKAASEEIIDKGRRRLQGWKMKTLF